MFDEQGRPLGMEVGSPASLGEALRGLLARGTALEDALPPFTTSPAGLLRLEGKGRIAVGVDADLVILDDEARVADVMAGGRWMVRAGEPVVRGPFEQP